MPFNLGSAVYNFQVSGLTQARAGLTSFHGTLQLLQRGNFLAPLNAGFSRMSGTLGMIVSRLGITSALFSGMAGLGIGMGVGGMVALAANMEQVQKSMQLMIGDIPAANALFEEMKSFGSKTPLEFPDIQKAGQQLINVKVATKDVIPLLRMLGDIGFPLRGRQGFQHMAFLYAQMKTQGRVTNQDLLQFANAGVPIYEALAKTMGVNVAQVRELASKGKVAFPQIHNALVGLTAAGGQFHGQMEEASKTMLGRWSTLVDILKTDVFTTIGQKIIDTFKLPQLLDRSIALAENFASTFGPVVDDILLKTKSAFDTLLPITLNIGSALLKVASALMPVGRALVGIVSSIATWINLHPELTSALVQTVTWTLVLRTSIFSLGGIILGSATRIGLLINTLQTLRSIMTGVAAVNNTSLIPSIARMGAAFMTALASPAGLIATLIVAIAGLGYALKVAVDRNERRKSESPDLRPWDARTQAAAESLTTHLGFKDKARMPKVGGKTQGQSSTASPGTPSLNNYPSVIPTGAAAGSSSTSTAAGKAGVGFVGISQLAEKMQLEALRATEQAAIADATKATADAVGKIAGAVDGGKMRVGFDPLSSGFGAGASPTHGRL